MRFQGRLGALAERNFRLVFSSTTISAVGDGSGPPSVGCGDHRRRRRLGRPAAAPPRARRRSFVLTPLGSIVADPIASVIGITETLIATTAIELGCLAVIIAQPSVWAIRADPLPEPVPA